MRTTVHLVDLLQIGCGVHVVRTGRPLYWIFILLIGSYIGVLVYLLMAAILLWKPSGLFKA